MSEPKRTPPGIDRETETVTFDYVKGNFFRVIHVDGVFGGANPTGKQICMAVWNERWPIPKQVVHRLSTQGALGDEIGELRVSRNAIVREVDVELIFDIDCAKQMRDWLNDKIAKAQAAPGRDANLPAPDGEGGSSDLH